MPDSAVISRLADYVSTALSAALPENVHAKARDHLLDTVASMVSGTRLPAGQLARAYACANAGRPDCTVIGGSIRVPAVQAAMANAIAAHSDETDDSHAASLSHPGCSIVPTALAFAERVDATLEDVIRAVVVGYEVGTRINLALDPYPIREVGHSTHSIGPTFGAAAAAAVLARLDAHSVRHVLSFAAQQASGLSCWMRDTQHIEKAFDFAGMPARNGATAADLVAFGFTGVDDVFAGERDFFIAFSESARTAAVVRPERVIDGLGVDFEIMRASIKKYTVGSPVQAPVDGLERLVQEHGFGANEVADVEIGIAHAAVGTVAARSMSSINLAHLCAVTIVDKTMTFDGAHDQRRADDPVVQSLAERIRLVGDQEASDLMPNRCARVRVTLTSGQRHECFIRAVRGSPENPMSTEEVDTKALDLMESRIGAQRANTVIKTIRGATAVDINTLMSLLGPNEQAVAH